MLNRLNNKRGSFSILAVTVVFILVLGFTLFLDITTKTYILNEIQANMDISGINALQSSVELDKLRAEIVSIDKDNSIDVGDRTSVITKKSSKYDDVIANKYRNEISKYVKANSSYIKKFEEKRIKVYFEYSDVGMGKSTDKRVQIVIDATYNAEVKVSEQFDGVGNISKKFRDGFGDTNFTVSQNGKEKDGYSNLIIRSVTRQVLR